ncbi:hypothetical protein HYN49_10585 [Flavobacterium pallidum]|uniref:Protein glutaminase domain-containing protein n=2 Tax=Flavobacterium pallidum TaxID=2172098 RepID=A0A2S1SIX8_9FLAO|nr:hypothetical protein HYN49_10585 [Flavobacterium pallidum]
MLFIYIWFDKNQNMMNTILSKISNYKLLAGEEASGKPAILKFDDHNTAVLPANHPYAGLWRETIAYLCENNRPAYVITDDNGLVEKVLMPVGGTIYALHHNSEGTVFSLSDRPEVYNLERTQQGFDGMLAVLNNAKEHDTRILITVSDGGVIDICPLEESYGSMLSGENPEGPVPFDIKVLTPISLERTNSLFKEMLLPNCTTTHSSGTSCIPFRVPSGGCWIRAHIMCYLMQDYDIVPGKIWCFSRNKTTLKAWTDNDWNCCVSWQFHVAPIVRVRQPDGTDTLMVIDPSLCSRPVSPESWQQLMDRGGSELLYSGWQQYDRFSGRATLEQAQKAMNESRILLDTTCKDHGMPPYQKCGRNA